MRTRLLIAFIAVMALVGTATASAAPSPILDFDLTQGSGTTVVDSANGVVGTTHGTVWSTDPSGMPVLYFDNPIVYWFGDGDYFEIPDHAALDSPQVSLEVMVYPMDSGYYTAIVDRARDGGTWQSNLHMNLVATGYESGTAPQFGITVGGVGRSVIAPEGIPLYAWSHIVGTYDGSDLKLYVDGVLVATESGVGGPRDTGSNPLYLGHKPTGNAYFNGYMSRFKMYDRALTAEEIAAEFEPAVTITNVDPSISGGNIEGNTPGGANVSFAVTVTDAEDEPDPAATCTDTDNADVDPNGTFFALGGPYTVTCSATDSDGWVGSDSVTFTVVDTTAPVLTAPSDLTETATSPTGNEVTFTASATDIVDPAPRVGCKDTSAGDAAVQSGDRFLGTHVISCTAADASNNVSAPQSFTIAVTFRFFGFYQPVDMNVHNSMKAGSTAPMKFQVGDGSGGFLSDLGIVSSASKVVFSCTSNVTEDPLEEYATGGSALRYDAASQQFIYNWQSPKGKGGSCYRVTILLTDGTPHSADFHLK